MRLCTVKCLSQSELRARQHRYLCIFKLSPGAVKLSLTVGRLSLIVGKRRKPISSFPSSSESLPFALEGFPSGGDSFPPPMFGFPSTIDRGFRRCQALNTRGKVILVPCHASFWSLLLKRLVTNADSRFRESCRRLVVVWLLRGEILVRDGKHERHYSRATLSQVRPFLTRVRLPPDRRNSRPYGLRVLHRNSLLAGVIVVLVSDRTHVPLTHTATSPSDRRALPMRRVRSTPPHPNSTE